MPSNEHTERMWIAAHKCILATEDHPFLTALLDGTLPMEKFQFYILQDSLYLQEFASALRALAESDEASEEDKKALRGFADGADIAEAGLHAVFFEGWAGQVPEPKSVEPSPNTLLYTSYMSSVVARKPHCEGLAVLLPCFWVYIHVGQTLVKRRAASQAKRATEYDEWLDLYGGEEFEKAVLAYKDMVEAAAARADEGGRERMVKHFVKSCELEWLFWYAAVEKQQWPSFP